MNKHIQPHLFGQRNYSFRCVAVASCFLYERALTGQDFFFLVVRKDGREVRAIAWMMNKHLQVELLQ